MIIDGVDVGTLDPTRAALFRRRKVGLIYQFFNLIPTLSVEKNIALPLLLDKRKPDPAFFDQLIRTLGLEEKRRALPGQLSGGQQQRVAHCPGALLPSCPAAGGRAHRQSGPEKQRRDSGPAHPLPPELGADPSCW